MRAHDAGVNGGGFAPLEASCRRVAGVSWLYWCNFPRLVAPSTWAKLNRVPLTAQFPRLVAPSTWAELDHAPLMVQFPPVWWRPRRGPSSTVHLSQRKSPRLVAVMSRFRALRSRFRVVRSRFEVAWRPKCRPPRRQTPTMGRRGRGGLRSGHNGAWPRVELARNR